MRECARCGATLDFERDLLLTLPAALYVHAHPADRGMADDEDEDDDYEDEDYLYLLYLPPVDQDPTHIDWDDSWLPDDPLWPGSGH